MIINLLIFLIVTLVSGIFHVLDPFEATLASIPFIGTQLNSIVTTMALSWNAFMVTVPYTVFVYHVFLWVILPFELTMLLAKFLLGSRIPVNTN